MRLESIHFWTNQEDKHEGYKGAMVQPAKIHRKNENESQKGTTKPRVYERILRNALCALWITSKEPNISGTKWRQPLINLNQYILRRYQL